MVEKVFEADLERLFADAPAMPDRDVFVARVAMALDRGWLFRRLVIGGLGLAGGLIGGAQVLRFGLVGRVLAIRDPALSVSHLWRLPFARSLSQILSSGASMDTEVLWMSGALALVALGLFVTRTVKNL